MSEEFDGLVENKAAADRVLKAWREEMPEVPSAYRPSGALPASAVVALSVGAVVGALAGGGVVFIGGALVGAAALVVAAGVACAGLLSVGVVLLGLLVTLATFVVAGWVSAACTGRLGRWGKNRNTRAAVTLSAFSGVLSGVVAWTLFQAVRNLPALAERQVFGPQIGGFDVIPAVFAVLGGLVAAILAGFYAAEFVHSAKFCEDCKRSMRGTELKRVSLGGLRALAGALHRKDLDGAAGLLPASSGQEGRVELFTCPCCSRGYLELSAAFKARWKEKKDKEEKSSSWLVASAELSAADITRFRPNP